MSSVNAAPAHQLLRPTDKAASHSTKPQGRATQAAFADYAFGPIEDGKSSKKSGSSNSSASSTGVKAVTGAFGQSPAAASTLAWVQQLQMTAGVKPTDKG